MISMPPGGARSRVMGSIFRLHFGEDKYPISRLLVYRARALGLTRSDLARSLGYRELGDAHKALANALKTGDGSGAHAKPSR